MRTRRKQRETRTHAIKWAVVAALVCGGVLLFGGIQGTLSEMDEWVKDLPSIEDTYFTNNAQESVVLASDGKTVLAQFQLEKRDPTTFDKVSPYVKKATVDTEDVRYYDHDGVDLAGVIRAVANNFLGGELEGASTITQQLVRNTILTQEATDISFERKIREAVLATKLEKEYSKDDILMMYLNTINYGDGCYGIEAAAKNYFKTSAKDLTLSQAATLCGIPQSPTYLNPKEYPDECLARRNKVLERMLDAGDITQDEYDKAVKEKLDLNPAPEIPEDGIMKYPYFTSYVRQLLMDEDNQFGVSYADLFKGGLTIYTTLDTKAQEAAETACSNQKSRMADNLDACIVAVEPKTGYIKALVGGSDYRNDQWNIATQGGRPAASCFKTFTLATAIEQGICPQTLIDCSNPLKMSDGTKLYNLNKKNQGIRTIQSATAVSSNTGYYRLIEQVSPRSVREMAKRLGVSSKISDYPAITLGTENVTMLEMASAYATLANNGVRNNPIAVTKIADKDGNVIFEAASTSVKAIEPEVAGAVTSTLKATFTASNGTAHDAQLDSGQPIAGKTGTGVDYRDHWLCGYTPALSAAAWIGDRDYQSTDESITANQLWKEFMDLATDGSDTIDFEKTARPKYDNPFNGAQRDKLSVKVADKAPSTVGKNAETAKNILFGYKVKTKEGYSDTIAEGKIAKQTANKGVITLTVSKGRDPKVVERERKEKEKREAEKRKEAEKKAASSSSSQTSSSQTSTDKKNDR